MLRKVAEHGSMLAKNIYIFQMVLILCWILDTNKVYGCEVRRRHHLERKNGGGYDPEEYNEHPERYISTFSKKV